VSHLFLIDPVADSALEQQIVARAARLGNGDTVHVEVIFLCAARWAFSYMLLPTKTNVALCAFKYVLIRGSVEEDMMNEIKKQRIESGSTNTTLSVVDFVLANLKIVL